MLVMIFMSPVFETDKKALTQRIENFNCLKLGLPVYPKILGKKEKANQGFPVYVDIYI